jgi:hypothetical protein
MAKQKKETTKKTLIKLQNLSADELKLVDRLKTLLNEKTAAGMIKAVLNDYEKKANLCKSLNELEGKHDELITGIRSMFLIAFNNEISLLPKSIRDQLSIPY